MEIPFRTRNYIYFDPETSHFNVIVNIKAAMAKRHICDACDALYDRTDNCDKVCSLCIATPPCTKTRCKHCDTCKRSFLSDTCFQNHLPLRVKAKLVCAWKQVCKTCSLLVTSDRKHESFKIFCNVCNKLRPTGHFCYMSPLKPSKLSKYMYVFYDIECSQDLERNQGSFEHIPNLLCAQQMSQV